MHSIDDYDTLVMRDLKHIWHPCSQMKDYVTLHPRCIVGAQGAYLQQHDGHQLIDAISSWWCKPVGHGHPRLRQALIKQAQQFEHVILANTTNEVIVNLSERLAQLTPHLKHVAYASDGACVVEMAIKMSLHARQLMQQPHRNQFASLSNAYHGDTCTTLAMSDIGIYRQPYQALLPQVTHIQQIPYVSGLTDPLWHDCSAYWPSIQAQLDPIADQLTAILVEPIVQGAGGMLIYSADFLRRLRQWSQAHGIHLIADELVTGFGRTGPVLACEHAGIEPDFLCLGKSLSGGWLPLSAVLTRSSIYELFYDDYEQGKSFLHSHTYAGNALAAAVALEFLTLVEEEQVYANVHSLASWLATHMHKVAAATGKLRNIRGIGGLIAADLIVDDSTQRMGYAVYQHALALGALLRPLGNTLYWLPPLNCDESIIAALRDITIQAIQRAYDSNHASKIIAAPLLSPHNQTS